MCDTPDSLMLFAAGFGTRMGALTADRPKPLVEVAGRPLLDHALELVEEAGISKVVANIHYRGDQIVQHLAGRSVEISDETDEILETGGGLRKALPLLGQGPVFTLNTDAIWTGPNPLAALRAAWDPAKMSALLMLVPPERATGHKGAGDFTLSEGRLSRGPGFVYTGAQLIDPAELSDISEGAFSLNLLWDRLLTKGRVYGVIHDGGWCDVGRPESIPLAEALLERRDD
ncbi:nucleotidyltransferase family protein [Thioclava sp. GXIMD4216]|uniref:nucleotidyltransferase family protein n=1 Tax=Thioclava sp. GXIMD4216 TaxID=3131929 RepID=UPI0030CD9CB0